MANTAASETIFALSSAPGRAGVAVVRISGDRAGAAVTALAGAIPPPRQARLARLVDPASGEVLDRGLVLWFPAPRSFTGEDVAELHLHGGPAVIAATLEALSRIPGLRPAEAGAFTRRAFEHGKLDLSAVEGLADLIDAETEAQRRQALRQMEGALWRRTEAWRERLVALLAHLEATIDFPEEGLPDTLLARLHHNIYEIQGEISQHLDDRHRGERLRDGLYIAIIGAPNAGKSTLLNALAGRDAAIVSETAGTTRDIVEVALDLGGYPVTLADTAGLRPRAAGDSSSGTLREAASGAPAAGGQEAIEAEGVRRALARAAAADLKLAVFDLREAPSFDRPTRELVDDNTIPVLNKADLVANPERISLRGREGSVISARTGAGLPALLERIQAEVADRLGQGGAAPVVTRLRHRRALEDCAAALARAQEAAPLGEVMGELVAEDLRLALRALGRITGRVDVEDVLEVIFRDFCIGK